MNFSRPFVLIATMLLLTGLFQLSCKSKNKDFQSEANNPKFLHEGIYRITDIIRHDIFSPPVAARIYAYSAVAAYEALIPGYPEYKSFAGQLNDLTPCPKPEAEKTYCYPLSSVTALLIVGKQLIFSEVDISEIQDSVLVEFQKMNIPKDIFDRSMAYGEAVAKHIIEWSKHDNYAETRSSPKFSIINTDPARWVPTPPTYSDAVEPHWKTIRPWALDSARQIKPMPHTPFSTDKNSAFFKGAMEVYEVSQKLTDQDKETAVYWDCNPFEVTISGHFMVSTKKITPGGHWMNIAGNACKMKQKSMMESAEVYAMVAVTLADAFISSWTEKFTSTLVRPVTYINLNIDQSWQPYIETPPFPEHTSAHATISAASATVLNHYFGDNFEFTDSTETIFGMDPRHFNNFYEASDQAAMSRLYGGIHYRQGNEGGRMNGREIGKYMLEHLNTRNNTVVGAAQ